MNRVQIVMCVQMTKILLSFWCNLGLLVRQWKLWLVVM